MGKVALPSTHWYQSRSSRPDAGKTVLEGTCFAHKIVADFPTIEMAERAVRAVNAFEPMLEALRIAQTRILELGSQRDGDRESLEAYCAVSKAIKLAEGDLCRGETEMVHPLELRA